jgi:MFS transporter, OFA family, oxalate/formate antiporter
LLKGRIFYGWWVTLGCLLITMVNGGIFYTFSSFFKPVAADFGWSRNETSINYSVMLLAYAPGAFFSGWLARRYGPRKTMLAVAVLIAGGYGVYRLAGNLPVMIFGYVLIGLGLGTTLGLPTAIIMPWFVKLRGAVFGLVNAGNGIGGLIFAPLASFFITRYGWQTSYLLLGLTFGAMVAIGASVLVMEPGMKKLKPYGSREGLHMDYELSTPAYNLPRALKNRTFWGIAVLYILCGLPIFFFMSHMVPLVTDKGISPDLAAQGLGLIAAMGVIGTLVICWIAGKFGWMKTEAICLFVAAASVVYVNFLQGIGSLYVFIVFYGLSSGCLIALLGGASGSFFGLKGLSEILGFMLGISIIFGAILPWVGGLIFDLTGTYFLASAITAAILVTAGIIAVFLRSPQARSRTYSASNRSKIES